MTEAAQGGDRHEKPLVPQEARKPQGRDPRRTREAASRPESHNEKTTAWVRFVAVPRGRGRPGVESSEARAPGPSLPPAWPGRKSRGQAQGTPRSPYERRLLHGHRSHFIPRTGDSVTSLSTPPQRSPGHLRKRAVPVKVIASRCLLELITSVLDFHQVPFITAYFFFFPTPTHFFPSFGSERFNSYVRTVFIPCDLERWIRKPMKCE